MTTTNRIVANALAANTARNAELTPKQKEASGKITIAEKSWDAVVRLHNDLNRMRGEFSQALRNFGKALTEAESALAAIPDAPSNSYNAWTSYQRKHIKGMRDEYRGYEKYNR